MDSCICYSLCIKYQGGTNMNNQKKPLSPLCKPHQTQSEHNLSGIPICSDDIVMQAADVIISQCLEDAETHTANISLSGFAGANCYAFALVYGIKLTQNMYPISESDGAAELISIFTNIFIPKTDNANTLQVSLNPSLAAKSREEILEFVKHAIDDIDENS